MHQFHFKKRQAQQHHQLALGLSAEWSLLGDGWIPPLFWFSGPSLHDGALSPRSVPGGSWERESPARLQQPSLWSSGHRHCHWGLDTSTSDLQIGRGPPAVASLSFVDNFSPFSRAPFETYAIVFSFCKSSLSWSLNNFCVVFFLNKTMFTQCFTYNKTQKQQQ